MFFIRPQMRRGGGALFGLDARRWERQVLAPENDVEKEIHSIIT